MAELRAYVFGRDRGCIFRHRGDHECRGANGLPHAPDARLLLQLGHVPEAGRNALQKKAPDDELHTVTICASVNIPGESKADREYERSYIAAAEKQ
jgi:hypothetical protein